MRKRRLPTIVYRGARGGRCLVAYLHGRRLNMALQILSHLSPLCPPCPMPLRELTISHRMVRHPELAARLRPVQRRHRRVAGRAGHLEGRGGRPAGGQRGRSRHRRLGRRPDAARAAAGRRGAGAFLGLRGPELPARPGAARLDPGVGHRPDLYGRRPLLELVLQPGLETRCACRGRSGSRERVRGTAGRPARGLRPQPAGGGRPRRPGRAPGCGLGRHRAGQSRAQRPLAAIRSGSWRGSSTAKGSSGTSTRRPGTWAAPGTRCRCCRWMRPGCRSRPFTGTGWRTAT
jgi:hypothetical protein